MNRSIRQRIDREAIVRAALAISRSTATQQPQAITGATLGKALQVDRSAVWRHFSDKYELIAAVADRALEKATYPPAQNLDPWERLEHIARSVIEVFREHPTLAKEAVGVPTLGENGLRLAEVVLEELGRLGMSLQQASKYYRVFTELTLSYASTLAVWDLRPEEQQEIEEKTVREELVSLDHRRYPRLAVAGPFIAELGVESATELVLDMFRITLEKYVDPIQ